MRDRALLAYHSIRGQHQRFTRCRHTPGILPEACPAPLNSWVFDLFPSLVVFCVHTCVDSLPRLIVLVLCVAGGEGVEDWTKLCDVWRFQREKRAVPVG